MRTGVPTANQPGQATGPSQGPLVAVLGGRRSLEILKQLGYRVALVNAEIPLELTLLADVPIEVDLGDWDAVVSQLLRVQRSTPVEAVVTQMDSLVPLAGYLREQLHLSTGISFKAALNCRDKARTRAALEAAGVPSAAFRVVESVEDALAAASLIGYPVIVKPRDAASGAHLMLCRTAEEVKTAAARIFETGRSSALLEEFLEGEELVVFAYRSGGRTELVSCLDVQVGPPPKFVKLGAQQPSRISAQRLDAVRDVTERCLAALELDNWVATVQLMLTASGPRIIEVNPRVPGGQMVELIIETTGFDPTRLSLEVALGRVPFRDRPTVRQAWYRCLTFDQAGRLYYRAEAETEPVPGLHGPRQPVVELDVAPGEFVLPINHPRGGVFGRIILFGDSDEQLAHDFERVLGALSLRLEAVAEADGEAAWRPHTKCC